MKFADEFSRAWWERGRGLIAEANADAVRRALSRRGHCSLEDFAALLSPAAAPFLPEMARQSEALTRRRFGRTIQMYLPLYLSNECQNICTYCGFSFHNKLPRVTLTEDQMATEAEAIRAMGYEHVLLVSGEAHKTVGVDYFIRAARTLRRYFSQISIEVQPLESDEYAALAREGVHAVLVYQETYDAERYRTYHPKGRKANFGYRLDTPDRIGAAGLHKIGLGALLGLSDWRTDSWCVGLHLAYLRKAYWKTRFSISFPRLRPAEGTGDFEISAPFLSDRDLVQLVCAWRLLDENLELSLSTREEPRLRDTLLPLGITSTSAGSRTDPGGYAVYRSALKQFEVGDHRSPDELATAIRRVGLEPVWKDWDVAYSAPSSLAAATRGPTDVGQAHP